MNLKENDTLKSILLEGLKVAENKIEDDLSKDKEAQQSIRYFLRFFKFVGIDIVEQLALEGKIYVQHQVELRTEQLIEKASLVISKIMTLVVVFLIVSIGLVFGAIAFSLWLGEIVNNTALGFLMAGVIWIVVVYGSFKLLFNKGSLKAKMLSVLQGSKGTK